MYKNGAKNSTINVCALPSIHIFTYTKTEHLELLVTCFRDLNSCEFINYIKTFFCTIKIIIPVLEYWKVKKKIDRLLKELQFRNI